VKTGFFHLPSTPFIIIVQPHLKVNKFWSLNAMLNSSEILFLVAFQCSCFQKLTDGCVLGHIHLDIITLFTVGKLLSFTGCDRMQTRENGQKKGKKISTINTIKMYRGVKVPLEKEPLVLSG
jgi:hypothetical protein